MKLNLFIRNNCDFCKAIIIPEEVNINIINVEDDSYNGYVPEQVPMLQYNGVSISPPHIITNILNLVKAGQDGLFKKKVKA
tara:strand:- start:128 stop:370 length:243 start_codon:yes stop_codon:yes gene_type:complete